MTTSSILQQAREHVAKNGTTGGNCHYRGPDKCLCPRGMVRHFAGEERGIWFPPVKPEAYNALVALDAVSPTEGWPNENWAPEPLSAPGRKAENYHAVLSDCSLKMQLAHMDDAIAYYEEHFSEKTETSVPELVEACG